jgi:protein involved in polysaccharide export with SLBB domain
MFGFLTLFLLFLVSPGFAQESKDIPEISMEPSKHNGQMDYRLGPADILAISVLGLKEFTQANAPWIDITVSNSGKIHLPYLGILFVNNTTPAELESEIARLLREKELLKKPVVTVRVKDYRGQTIYIIGEVMQPGQYYLRGETYLLDLMALSLGVPTEGTMYLYRRSLVQEKVGEDVHGSPAASGETAIDEAIPIDIKEVAEGKRPEMNLKLQGGDVLYVPFNRPKYFYATGEVQNPGSFELPPSRQILVSQAVSFAGGPTKTAKMSKGILVRYDQNGMRQEMALDFDAILRGKKPDFPVSPSDIIFIPGSHAKTLGYGLLAILPTLATATMY